MTSSPSKSPLKMAVFPRSFSLVAASMAILVMFWIFASWFLVSYRNEQVPIRSSVHKDSFQSESNKELPTIPKDSDELRISEMPEKSLKFSELLSEETEMKVDSSSSSSSNQTESNAVDFGRNELPKKPVQFSDTSSIAPKKKVDTWTSKSSNATQSNSVELRRNEIPEKPLQLSESSFGATEKKVDTSSSKSSNETESNLVDLRRNEMPEKPLQLSESSSGAMEKKVDTSSSTSSNATQSNSVNLGRNEMPEKPLQISESTSGATEEKMDTSSSTSREATESNSVDSRRNEMPEKPTELSESSSGATEKKVDTSSSASNNATQSNLVESVDSRKNEMPEKPVQLSEPLSGPTEKKVEASSSASRNAFETNLVDSGCDLYHGKWFYDPQGPLYTNSSCPIITQMQNCQGNLRPDKEYEYWRWKPSQCDLPRFDAKKFLELMRKKTLAFIGDSVARNHMESLLCLLWQVEVPRNRGNRRMHRYYFRSTSVTIVRLWSSWLVHQTTKKFDFAPEGVTKLHLDAPDYSVMELIPKFDVIIFSSGHWFAKQSVYLLNNEIVGGQLWWPDHSRPMKVNNIDAYGISVETILSAIATHPNYTGLTIVRSFSPDHYEGGSWNTGGSCTGKVKPLASDELVENGFTNIMHEKQVMGFKRAAKNVTNKSKLRLMDITKAFEHRHDGHPGPYRSADPNKITTVGKDGRPPPQDCLHWCMPGPVDTWNELVLEIIRREFEGLRTQG